MKMKKKVMGLKGRNPRKEITPKNIFENAKKKKKNPEKIEDELSVVLGVPTKIMTVFTRKFMNKFRFFSLFSIIAVADGNST